MSATSIAGSNERRSIAQLRSFAIALFCGLGLAGQARADIEDLADLSLEQLLDIEVVGASKFAQKSSAAPASVTVVTAEEIRTYGYRTLGDVLKSVRGLFVSYDRNYSYLGVRGFNRPGDYNSHVLLLVDGYRMNDAVYAQAFVGTESPLDVELIDRVEVIRGPGSSIYGDNAFFAVINIITRRGKDFDAVEAAAQVASHGTDRERVAYGGRTSGGGFEWMASGSRYRSRGQNLFYPEFDNLADHDGIAQDADGDRYERLFGKLSGAGLTLTSGYSRRVKNVPTASYGSVFNDAREHTTDQSAFADLAYYARAGDHWEFTPHVYYGRYVYRGIYPYDAPPTVLNNDSVVGVWWGAEIKAVGHFDRHTVVAGTDYQWNPRQDQLDFDESPYTLYVDERRSSSRAALYIQDDVMLARSFHLNAGLRYDHYSTVGGSTNPRLALIWNPSDTTSLKLLYGTAFRAPNVNEQYWSAPDAKPNPDLKPEKIATYEFVAEQFLQPQLRVSSSVYFNRISNLINQVTDPVDGKDVYENTGRVDAKGVEIEVERTWTNGTRVRASHAWQIAKEHESGAELTDSPRHLSKLNVGVPIFGRRAVIGTEFQYTSNRRTLGGNSVGGAGVANITLSSDKLIKGVGLSLSAYNLLDKRYADPGRPEHVQDAIAQDGRTFRFSISYRY